MICCFDVIFFLVYICDSVDEFIGSLSGRDVGERITIIYFILLGKLINLLRFYPVN